MDRPCRSSPHGAKRKPNSRDFAYEHCPPKRHRTQHSRDRTGRHRMDQVDGDSTSGSRPSSPCPSDHDRPASHRSELHRSLPRRSREHRSNNDAFGNWRASGSPGTSCPPPICSQHREPRHGGPATPQFTWESWAIRPGNFRRPIPLIDTGAYLTRVSEHHAEQMLERCGRAGVSTVVVSVSLPEGAQRAQGLCEHINAIRGLDCRARYTVGVHPRDADEWQPAIERWLDQHLQTQVSHCIGVGECGLEFESTKFPDKETQLRCFKGQLELARAYKLPISVFERGATNECVQAIKESGIKPDRVIIRSFRGSAESLQAYIECGCNIGINGFITHGDGARNFRESLRAAKVPLHTLMLESLAPFNKPNFRFLVPDLAPKSVQNEPACLPAIVRSLARALVEPEEKVAWFLSENARRVFQIRA